MILAMMTGLLALQGVTGQATPLRPLTPPGSWITNNDYPSSSVANREFGITAFRLDIGTDGKVAACRILVSSGFWRLDQQVYAVLMKRARFKAALDAAGKPIPATFQSRFYWILPGTKQDYIRLAEEVAPAMELTVSLNRLPTAYQKPALVRVRFQRDAVDACSIETGSGSDALDRIACQQAEQEFTRPPYRKGLVTQPDTRMVRVIFVGEGKAK